MREQEAKQLGMKFAAQKNSKILSEFRRIAETISMYRSLVTIDDVRSRADQLGIQYIPGNWMGSVFKGWKWSGLMQASTHKGSHGRMVKVWRKEY